MFAIVDCDNCYVSCERVFHPELNGKPVVVLSNNDGCVVARSNEAKLLGIKAGMPYFKMMEQHPNDDIAVFSSNYELYGDMTDRVMTIVRNDVPEFCRYSIDEGFCDFKGLKNSNLKAWGEALHNKIRQWTGMPVSIGIGPTKTLAKVASHYAKHYKGYRHCCIIDTPEKRRKALARLEIGDVWGIGRQNGARLMGMGIQNALQFADKPQGWVRAVFNIVVERTWRELNGEDCIPPQEMSKKKSILTSRSFPDMVDDIETLRTSISNFAARCAQKLRRQRSVAHGVSVFIDTNRFREDQPQYWNSSYETLLTPTNSTQAIVQAAFRCTERIFRQGYKLKRAGVMVSDLLPDTAIQTNFVDYDSDSYRKQQRLDEVIDRINRINGSETIVLGSQQYTAQGGKGKAGVFRDSIRHEFRSPNYTTRWGEIPEAD